MSEPRDIQAELNKQFADVMLNDYLALNAYRYAQLMHLDEVQTLQSMVIALSRHNANLMRMLQDIVIRSPVRLSTPEPSQTHYPPREKPRE